MFTILGCKLKKPQFREKPQSSMAQRKMPRLEGCHEKIMDTKLYSEVSNVNITSINPPNPPPNDPNQQNKAKDEEKDDKKQDKKEDK